MRYAERPNLPGHKKRLHKQHLCTTMSHPRAAWWRGALHGHMDVAAAPPLPAAAHVKLSTKRATAAAAKELLKD